MRLRSLSALLGALTCGAIPILPAMAGTLTTLYSFAGQPDGATPLSGVISYSGLLYGTTSLGGVYNAGIVYALKPVRRGKESTIYQFTPGYLGAGQNPTGQSLAYHDGFAFGANTNLGGSYGTIFKIDLSNGSLLDLYDCGQEPDPEQPNGVIYAHNALYGTSLGGIGANGTVFEINPVTGTETTLYEFAGGSAGSKPASSLIYVAGALYGTTSYGGSAAGGVIFRIDPATGAETVAYNFKGGADGSFPNGMISVGNLLFGTTQTGGPGNKGTVFSFDTASAAETVLHAFGGQTDGAAPIGGMVYRGGTLFGTASAGGSANGGTIFAVDVRRRAETTLHNFLGKKDGASPVGALLDLHGVLYGTASAGGEHGFGTVFTITP